MQCRLPKKIVPIKKNSRRWYLNETISWSDSATYNADFTCNGDYYDAIGLTYSSNPKSVLYIRYRKHGSTRWTHAAELVRISDPPFRWLKEVYRTITFDVLPTGDLLTWLTANATPQ